MKQKYWLSILMAIILALIMPIEALAATTSTVTVTFTPRLVAIGVTTPNTWAAGSIPDSGTAETATGYFSTANTSNVSTNITVGVVNATWTGGTAFTHSNAGNPGADTVAMKASPNTGAFNIVVAQDTPLELKHELAATTALLWEAKLWAATSSSDNVQKTNTIILAATAH